MTTLCFLGPHQQTILHWESYVLFRYLEKPWFRSDWTIVAQNHVYHSQKWTGSALPCLSFLSQALTQLLPPSPVCPHWALPCSPHLKRPLPSSTPWPCFIVLHNIYSLITLLNKCFKGFNVCCCLPDPWARAWAQQGPEICLLSSPYYHGVSVYSIKMFCLIFAKYTTRNLVTQTAFQFYFHEKKFRRALFQLLFCTNICWRVLFMSNYILSIKLIDKHTRQISEFLRAWDLEFFSSSYFLF